MAVLLMPLIAVSIYLLVTFSYLSFNSNISSIKGNFEEVSLNYDTDVNYNLISLRDVSQICIDKSKDDKDFVNAFKECLKVESGLRREGFGSNLFLKLYSGDYSIESNGDLFNLELEGVSFREVIEGSEVIYTFNLVVEFDEDKVLETKVIVP